MTRSYTATMDDSSSTRRPIRGRGVASNPAGRFESRHYQGEDDGWPGEAEEAAQVRVTTHVTTEIPRSAISRNDSPDVPFDQAINPYRGCEHGCAYCYARPSHAYLNLSPGLDFETRLTAKTGLAEVLRLELARPGYRVAPINLGSNTDPYQPIEKQWRLSREILQLLVECRHPCTIVSKNAMLERDMDLLAQLAAFDGVRVFISVNSLDNRLASRLEPRASAPHRRIQAIRRLAEAGIPVGVLVSPIIPALNDRDMEAIIGQAAEAGADCAGYTTIRLPHELKSLFREWLAQHYPQRAAHIISLIQQMHAGRDYDSDFRHRMHGQGQFAQLIRRRFDVAVRRHGLADRVNTSLNGSAFVPPRKSSPQGELF
ncbi:PA0069 family radical SAM protein [Frateuria aurantia]